MRTTVTAIAVAIAACMAWLGGAAFMGAAADASASATAKKSRPAGTAYVASTPAGAVHLVLSSDRRQVRSALFAYKQACSDGSTNYDYDLYQAIPISANRKFEYRYDSGAQPSATTPGATFAYTETIAGTLNKAGTKIVGTAKSTFSYTDPAGVTTSCDSGTVAFKAVD
jgi:hypothetical protein